MFQTSLLDLQSTNEVFDCFIRQSFHFTFQMSISDNSPFATDVQRPSRSISEPESISIIPKNEITRDETQSLKNFPSKSFDNDLDKVPKTKRTTRMEMNGINFTLAHFDLLKVLGKGSFGKVSCIG